LLRWALRPPRANASGGGLTAKAKLPTAQRDPCGLPIRFTSCRGVQPGGSAALQCLTRNVNQLAAECRSALTAINSGASAQESVEVPAERPAKVSLGPIPKMNPREALMILRLCSPDSRSVFPEVEPGGGRLISCLVQKMPLRSRLVATEC
jgi:hypothetical protein